MDKMIHTEEQIRVFNEFKIRVADLHQRDTTIAQFLVARDFNIDAAEEMLRKSVLWRKENNVDNVLNEFDKDSEVAKAFPFKVTGFDEEGSVIVLVPFGQYDGPSWLESGGQEKYDELLRWGIYQMEDILRVALSVPNPQQSKLIYDMDGLTYSKAVHYSSLKLAYETFKILEQNYPESAKSLYIINAPWTVYIPFNLLKTIFSKRTLSKVQIFNTNKSSWIDSVRQLGPMESLPQQYFQK